MVVLKNAADNSCTNIVIITWGGLWVASAINSTLRKAHNLPIECALQDFHQRINILYHRARSFLPCVQNI